MSCRRSSLDRALRHWSILATLHAKTCIRNRKNMFSLGGCPRRSSLRSRNRTRRSSQHLALNLALGIKSNKKHRTSSLAPNRTLRQDDCCSSHHWRTQSRFPGRRLHVNIVVVVIQNPTALDRVTLPLKPCPLVHASHGQKTQLCTK